MNDMDLIDELREGMHARTDDTAVPAGFADHARRTARRRSARRAATAGAPLLAVAGVATVIATGAAPGGSAGHGAGGPNLAAPGGQTHDTAYVLKRVKANLAAGSQDGTVIHSVDYRTGQVGPDGSLINLGWKMNDGYGYSAPDGTEYDASTQYQPSGTVQLTQFDTFVPEGNGRGTDTQTVINPASHEYSQKQYPGAYDLFGEGALDMMSTPSQVEQALQSGQVTQQGTATIDGTPAIALLMTVPSSPPQTTVLYVDAQGYQPLRLVQQVNGGGHVLHVEDWMPATAANVAQAKADSIPSGFTQAAPAKVY